jgi:uncharacterized protein YabN with tetrapyrrole methylase and pyrophosphatase domain
MTVNHKWTISLEWRLLMSQAESATSTANGGSALPLGAIEVPWNLVVPEVDVHVVGYGNRLPNDFTLELLAVLKSCTRIFGAPPIHAPEFGIPPMENLLELCAADGPHGETYEEMVEVVLAAAAADPPVAFATSGSPMVGTHPAHRIVELAAERGLTAHVTNAVPSFDAIWADLNIEPFFGLEIWDATTFVRLEIKPNTRAHLLLAQAPMLAVTEGTGPETMSILRDHLLRFYPREQEVHCVSAEAGVGPRLLATGIETVALGDLDHPGRQHASTLVLPRAERAPFDFERSAPAAG